VQVPLTRDAVRLDDPSPRGSAEGADPVVGRVAPARPFAVAEVVAGPPAARRRGQRTLKPRMLIGGVIGDEIDDDLQVVAVRIINQLPRVSQGAE
jgi:hypothetical protein